MPAEGWPASCRREAGRRPAGGKRAGVLPAGSGPASCRRERQAGILPADRKKNRPLAGSPQGAA
ncbi:hypothetical protein HMPREF0731_2147, partial [Pseudoroseomonas cervicalis ATCC 49957]